MNSILNDQRPIGFIGLGQMGAGMAMTLAGSNTPMLIYDINPEATAIVEKFGAKIVESIDDLAMQCELVFLCLPSEQQVESLLFSDHGLLKIKN